MVVVVVVVGMIWPAAIAPVIWPVVLKLIDGATTYAISNPEAGPKPGMVPEPSHLMTRVLSEWAYQVKTKSRFYRHEAHKRAKRSHRERFDLLEPLKPWA